MTVVRDTDLRDKVLRKYHLSSEDISAVNMASLFLDTLNEYSRFRGLRDQQLIPFTAGTTEYDLDENVFHILAVLWNDTYPNDDILTSDYTAEQYHFPSLLIIKDTKIALERLSKIVTEQEWQVYGSENGETKKLVLHPTPITNIYVLYRKLFTNKTYPFTDERIIEYLYEANMLQFCQSTGIVVQEGNIRLDQKRMDDRISKLLSKFYNYVSPAIIGT